MSSQWYSPYSLDHYSRSITGNDDDDPALRKFLSVAAYRTSSSSSYSTSVNVPPFNTDTHPPRRIHNIEDHSRSEDSSSALQQKRSASRQYDSDDEDPDPDSLQGSEDDTVRSTSGLQGSLRVSERRLRWEERWSLRKVNSTSIGSGLPRTDLSVLACDVISHFKTQLPEFCGAVRPDHKELSSKAQCYAFEWEIHVAPLRFIFRLWTGAAAHITDRELLSKGVGALWKVSIPCPKNGMPKGYRQARQDFFSLGTIFIIPWPHRSECPSFISGTTKYLRSFTARQFVVVRKGESFCSVLPITTHREAVGVRDTTAAICSTGIVYAEPYIPPLLSGEEGPFPEPIRICWTDCAPSGISRIEYEQVCSVSFDVPVRKTGWVCKSSLNDLERNLVDFWSLLKCEGKYMRPGQNTAHGEDDDGDDDDDDDNDDDDYGDHDHDDDSEKDIAHEQWLY